MDMTKGGVQVVIVYDLAIFQNSGDFFGRCKSATLRLRSSNTMSY